MCFLTEIQEEVYKCSVAYHVRKLRVILFLFIGVCLLFCRFFNVKHQLVRGDFQGVCDMPDSLKIRLLGSGLDHGQVAASDPGQSAANFLRKTMLFSNLPDYSTDCVFVVLYHCIHLLNIKCMQNRR